MISFLKGIFSSGETANKIVDGAVNGLDAMFYTDEEKAEGRQKVLDWKLKWLEATKPSNVARRVIAFVITGTWALIILVACGLQLTDFTEQSKFMFEVLQELVLQPFNIILGFYFAAHVFKGVKN